MKKINKLAVLRNRFIKDSTTEDLIGMKVASAKFDVPLEDLETFLSICINNTAEEEFDDVIYNSTSAVTPIESIRPAAEFVLRLNRISPEKTIMTIKDSLKITEEQEKLVQKYIQQFNEGKLKFNDKVITSEVDAEAVISLILDKLLKGEKVELDSDKEETEVSDSFIMDKEKNSSKQAMKEFGKRTFKGIWKGLTPMLNQIGGPVAKIGEDVVNYVVGEFKKLKGGKDLLKAGNDKWNKGKSTYLKRLQFFNSDTKPTKEQLKGAILSYTSNGGYKLGYDKNAQLWAPLDSAKVQWKEIPDELPEGQYLFKDKSGKITLNKVPPIPTDAVAYAELPARPNTEKFDNPVQELYWTNEPLDLDHDATVIFEANGQLFMREYKELEDDEKANAFWWTEYAGYDVSSPTTKGQKNTLEWYPISEYSKHRKDSAYCLVHRETDDSWIEELKSMDSFKETDVPDTSRFAVLDPEGANEPSRDEDVIKESLTWYHKSEVIPDQDLWLVIKGTDAKFVASKASSVFNRLKSLYVKQRGKMVKVGKDPVDFWAFVYTPGTEFKSPYIQARGHKVEMVWHRADVAVPANDINYILQLKDMTFVVKTGIEVSQEEPDIKYWSELNL